MLNLSEAVQRIKSAGSSNVRVVPMSGQSALIGLQRIEVKESGKWIGIVEGLQKKAAEDIVRQATNRVILG